jgi:serine/threonine-protein kinase
MEREQYIGNYRLIRRIGEGGMGDVFEALDPRIERRAAIKLMHPTFSHDRGFAVRFLNEARAVNRVRHPGLVNIYEFGETKDGALYIVMEYLEGETLRARLNSLGPGRGLEADLAVRLARQLASTLIAVHAAGITHRDLKPANIMLVADPDVTGGERAKLLDFGIAKVSGSQSGVSTLAGMALGTPHYMAPEQCYDASQVNGQADVYSLGVMLYEALAGKRPIEDQDCMRLLIRHITVAPEPLSSVAPNVPTALAVLVMAMMIKDPNSRPTMENVLKQLDSLNRITELRPTALPRRSILGRGEHVPAAAQTEATTALRRRTVLAFLVPVAVLTGLLWFLLRVTVPVGLSTAQKESGRQMRVASAGVAGIPHTAPITMEARESLPLASAPVATIAPTTPTPPLKRSEGKIKGLGKVRDLPPNARPIKEPAKKTTMEPEDVVWLD